MDVNVGSSSLYNEDQRRPKGVHIPWYFFMYVIKIHSCDEKYVFLNQNVSLTPYNARRKVRSSVINAE